MNQLVLSRYAILAGIAFVIVGANNAPPLIIVGAVLIVFGAVGVERQERSDA